MRNITPFVTLLCIALFFATIGPLNQLKVYISDFVINNSSMLAGLILGGVIMSILYFAVWVLRK